MATERMACWTWAWPLAAWAVLLATPFIGGGNWIAAIGGVVLLGAVFAAVYHAEMVAHRVGEPFGTLILALAVTVIETALIVSVMLAAPDEKAGLARDTVFSAVMIVCNGIVGICLLLGAMRHREQGFHTDASSAALSVLIALTSLSLILPNYAKSELGPLYSTPQLVFAGIVSLVLYGSFIFIQTMRHRSYFLPVETDGEEEHAPRPSGAMAAASAGLLVVALVAIVGVAKLLTPVVEGAIAYLDVPKAVVGIVIAMLVLLPESVAALRAATSNRLQISLNLALGSALATIGLTIPAVAAVSIAIGQPLQLGLDPKEQFLLALTLVLSVTTFSTGRTTVLQGIVHLVMFAVFLFFAIVP